MQTLVMSFIGVVEEERVQTSSPEAIQDMKMQLLEWSIMQDIVRSYGAASKFFGRVCEALGE